MADWTNGSEELGQVLNSLRGFFFPHGSDGIMIDLKDGTRIHGVIQAVRVDYRYASPKRRFPKQLLPK